MDGFINILINLNRYSDIIKSNIIYAIVCHRYIIYIIINVIL